MTTIELTQPTRAWLEREAAKRGYKAEEADRDSDLISIINERPLLLLLCDLLDPAEKAA